MSHGVRKINEYIIRDGRAIILTKPLSNDISLEKWNGIQDGTLFLEPISGTVKYKKKANAKNVWSKFLPVDMFDQQTITEELIKNEAITNLKLAPNSVYNKNIKDGEITNSKFYPKTIEEDSLKPLSYTGKIFIDNSINGSKIIDNTTNGDKLITRSVDGNKLKLNTITNSELGSNCVTIANNALSNEVVITTKIGNQAVTDIKMAQNSITINNNALSNEVVITNKIASQAITNSKMAQNSITRTNNALEDGVVINSKIADYAITDTKLAQNSITLANNALSNRVVVGTKIALNNIYREHLDSAINTILSNAVQLIGGTATVGGHLKVDGNIQATYNNLTQTITGFKVFNPVFKDFAEAFMSNEILSIGDIVEIENGDYVKKSSYHSRKIIGIVSDQFALCLGATEDEIKENKKVAIGLVGRLKVNVVGQVEIGDYIVSCGDGIGIASKKHIAGAIIGKALENKSSWGIDKIYCLIQPM